MKGIWYVEVIAEFDVTVVVEGNHYFSMDSVDDSYLKPSNKTAV